MLRQAVPAAFVLLLSGCLAAAPAQVDVAQAPADDGMTVTATRVEPLVHAVDVAGRIQAHLCNVGARTGETCAGGTVGVTGIDWDVPVRDFADPAALFWRVSLVADWQSSSLVTGLRMTVYATEPCGIACVELRRVDGVESATSPGFDRLDVYLEEGETGVRVKLEAVGYTETSWGEAAVRYRLHGDVRGYRPVADPVVVG